MTSFGHAGLHSCAGLSFPGPCGRRCPGDALLGLEFRGKVQVGLEYHLCPDISSYHERVDLSGRDRQGDWLCLRIQQQMGIGLGHESQDESPLILYA